MYHTISNLYIDSDEYFSTGLFAFISETATVKNLIMKNVDITSRLESYFCIGGIVAASEGNIINCGVESGQMKGFRKQSLIRYDEIYIGGICGWSFLGDINNCYNKANLYGEFASNVSNHDEGVNIGGICGITGNYDDKQNITNCYNMGEVTYVGSDRDYGGAILGTVYHGNTEIINCYTSYRTDIISICGTLQYKGYLKTSNCYNEEDEVNALKADCSNLGNAFVEDTIGINNGYPILKWELERRM